MPRYIDSEKIYYRTDYNSPVYDNCGGHCCQVGYDEVASRSEINKIPTADVAPVIHAKWEKITRTARYVDGIGVDVETRKPFIDKKEYKYDEYRCPVCRKFAKGDYLRYCDYCGAKFDEMFSGDEEENDG